MAISEVFLFLLFRVRSLKHIPYHEDGLNNETIIWMMQLLVSTLLIARRPAASVGTVVAISVFIMLSWALIEDPVHFASKWEYWLHLSRRVVLWLECLLTASGLPLFPLPQWLWRVFMVIVGVCHVVAISM